MTYKLLKMCGIDAYLVIRTIFLHSRKCRIGLFRKIAIALFFAVFLVMNSCSKANSETASQPTLIKNEDILVKTLLYTEWAKPSAVWSMNYAETRTFILEKLGDKCSNTNASLQEMNDADLAWGAMMYQFLLNGGFFSASRLSEMTLSDFRNVIIELNQENTGQPLQKFQDKSNAANLVLAYGWWFSKNSVTRPMIDKLTQVKDNDPSFGTKDDTGRGMDVLRVVKADERYTYLGVYHSMVGPDHFKLYLAGSNDLKKWTQLAELGDRAHQGDIKKWGQGYLVANEQDTVLGSNNVQVRYFASYADLLINKPSNKKSIVRSFAPTAEGTPDIRVVEGDRPENSTITIGFHYYENRIHDRQAFGILHNFKDWRAWIDPVSNFTIAELGFTGNFGARNAFSHLGNFVLQEAQITFGDWSSWRILFGNGAFYCILRPETPAGSLSFANPGIASLGNGKFAVTSFMPSEGNSKGEPGELFYTVQF